MTSRLTVFGAAGASGSSDHWISASSVNAIGYSGVADATGNVYVVGNTNIVPNFTTLLTKQNKNGVYQFQKTVARNSSSGVSPSLKNVFVEASNIYCGGDMAVLVSSSSYTVPYLVKYDLNGSVVWQRKIDVGTIASNVCVCKDSSANLYTTFYYYTTSYFSCLFKHNSSGTLQWQYAIANAFINKSTTDLSGNIYAVGSTQASTNGLGLLIKFNSSGTIQWQRTLAISGQHLVTRTVNTDSSGNIYVAGSYTNNMYMAKYNSSGTLEWQKTINSPASVLNSFIDNNNNYYIVSGNYSPYEARVFKFNSSGTLQWQRKLSANTILPSDIFADSSGNYYIVAQKYGASPFTYLSKLPADGSKTGTYGSYVYVATTYTISDGSMTTGTPTYTTTASSIPESANTTSQSNAAFTNTLTYI